MKELLIKPRLEKGNISWEKKMQYTKMGFMKLENYKELLIKYYYYTERGLDVINIFRNLFLGIIAIYVALHFVSLWWVVIMFVVSLPILIVMGYYNIHRISKVRDRLNIKYGSHYGIRQFDYTKGIFEELEKLNKKIK